MALEIASRSEGVKGAAETHGSDDFVKPTFDQVFLIRQINSRHGVGSASERRSGALTLAAVQKWNQLYGATAVSDALRLVHGFVQEDRAVRSVYAYIDTVLRRGVR